MTDDQSTLDISKRNKGDVIPVETIERISGIESTHPRFWGAKLDLRKLIKRTLRSQGIKVSIRECNENLEILTDEEATAYNFNWFRRYLNAAQVKHQDLLEVDTRSLSFDIRIEHQRRIEVSSFIVQGINDRVKQISSDYPKQSLPIPQFNDRVKTI